MKKITVIMALVGLALTASAQLRLDNAKNYANPKKGYYDKAKIEIDAACEEEGTKSNPEVWAWKGYIYCRLGESEKPKIKKVCPENWAEIAYEAALKSKELNTEKEAGIIELNNAVFKTVAGRFIDEAYNDYENAGKNNDTSLYRACINKVDKGIKIYQSSGAQDPQIKESVNYARYIGGSAARVLGDNKSAKMFYKPLVRAGYDKEYVYQSLVAIYQYEKDTIEAMKVAKTFTEKHPNDYKAFLLGARVSAWAGNVESAKTYAKAAMEKATEITDVADKSALICNIADIYSDIPDYETAQAEFARAIEIMPNNPMAYNGLGRLHYNKGIDFAKAADLVPPDKQDEYDQMMAKATQEYEESIKMYKKSLDINDKSDYEKQQRFVEALRSIKMVYARVNRPLDDLKVYEQ